MSNFNIYEGKDTGDQRWRWRLVDSNGKKIARSEEPFLEKGGVEKSIQTIKNAVDCDTPILNQSEQNIRKGYRFEYWQSEKDNQWYWSLKATNNEPMAIGGEGFSSKQSIVVSIENVRLEIGRAGVTS